MIKIVVCGICGRMGKEIISLVNQLDDIDIVGGVEAEGSGYIGKTIDGIKVFNDILECIGEADCIVEFTNPKATIDNLTRAERSKKGYVIGTTGFNEDEIQMIQSYSREIPIFLAPNMSRGVNHLYRLVELTTRSLERYDIEIIETHHRNKKDAPSGTARAIAQIIGSIKPDTDFVYGREGIIGVRKENEVGICSVRGGDVVGEHRVLFLGPGEFIELRHYATSRKAFASGAMDAVRFIVNKGPGFYTMKDLMERV